jgi:NADH-quinone oxidoreductase subunit N
MPAETSSHRLSEAAVALLGDLPGATAQSLGLIVPEIILAATIVAVVAYDMFFKREDSHRSGVLALMGCGGAWLAALAQTGNAAATGFHGAYVADALSGFFRVFFLLATFIVILTSLLSKEIDRYRQGEYHGVLMTATLAMCVLASAGNAIVFFLALETLSLSSYILAGYAKGTRHAAEASLKYLLYGAVASSILLFGLSYLYGATGTMAFPGMIVGALSSSAQGLTLISALGLLMVLAGLFFKIAIFPFHVWTPDVYQGAPTPIAGYLSVASKAAGFAALLRVVLPICNLNGLSDFRELAGLGVIQIDLRFVMGLLAAATMTIGNFAALRQRNLKRLLAYSSIAHAGYMLMAFSNPGEESVAAALAYLRVYLFMNLGFFFAVVLMENSNNGKGDMDDYAGYGRRYPFIGACLTLILVSLIGLPPTAGFAAKFYLFAAVLSDGQGGILGWQALLVLWALLNSVVSLAYYIRPAKILFFESPASEDAFGGAESQGASYNAAATLSLLALSLPLVGLFLLWGGVYSEALAVAKQAVGSMM